MTAVEGAQVVGSFFILRSQAGISQSASCRRLLGRLPAKAVTALYSARSGLHRAPRVSALAGYDRLARALTAGVDISKTTTLS